MRSRYEPFLFNSDVQRKRDRIMGSRHGLELWVIRHGECTANNISIMVGALARFNLNSKKLLPLAKEWAHKFGLRPITYNPFMNNVAQLIELAHSMEDSIALIDKLFNIGIRQETLPGIEVKAGRGIGVVEVPRGILFHDYTYSSHGRCVEANCIIPTNQNHNNIQKDMEAFATTLLEKPEKEIELNLEMLVRAYDPCISCSTHWI